MSRTTVVALLVCVNLVLLTAVLLVAVPPPRTAMAQGTMGLADKYMMVAGQIQSEFDALYIVDMQERLLHVFYFRRGTRDLEYGGYRMLERDFRHNRD
jgi:hypothetical protein